MKKVAPSKYQLVRAQLEEAIHSREFNVGEQLPTEQALADRFGVSYLTARRAVCELVKADLLERRARKGTFVRPHRTHQTTTRLSLITSSYDHSLMREFIRRGTYLAEQHGWKPNVIRLSEGQQDTAVNAIRNGDLALVLLDEIAAHGALSHAMRASRGRAICVASPTTKAGAPCIFSNPDHLFQSAVDYLVSVGHRDLIFVGQASPDAATDIQAQAWRQSTCGFLSHDEAEARCIRVETPLFHCPTQDAYDATRRVLDDGLKVSAFVSFGEEITQGVLAAIRESGKSIPDEISVLNILDGPSMNFSHPPVSSVDVNLDRHFEVAYELLDAAQKGEFIAPQNYFIEPRIIERQSVARACTLSGATS